MNINITWKFRTFTGCIIHQRIFPYSFISRNIIVSFLLKARLSFFISFKHWGSNKFEFHSSRIVPGLRLRKSSARPAPCLVEHRLQKQYSIVFASLTRNPLQNEDTLLSVFFISFKHWGYTTASR